MKEVISISEIVAPFHIEGEACEVWASAEAGYDETTSELCVKLGAFARCSKDNRPLPVHWLPPAGHVREQVDVEEASAAAKEIFASWAHRVRRAAEMRQKVMAFPHG